MVVEQCSICLQELNNDIGTFVPCGHCIHVACFREYAANHHERLVARSGGAVTRAGVGAPLPRCPMCHSNPVHFQKIYLNASPSKNEEAVDINVSPQRVLSTPITVNSSTTVVNTSNSESSLSHGDEDNEHNANPAVTISSSSSTPNDAYISSLDEEDGRHEERVLPSLHHHHDGQYQDISQPPLTIEYLHRVAFIQHQTMLLQRQTSLIQKQVADVHAIRNMRFHILLREYQKEREQHIRYLQQQQRNWQEQQLLLQQQQQIYDQEQDTERNHNNCKPENWNSVERDLR
jgi:hypothetical protein